MSFCDRQYVVFVVLGDPGAGPAWSEQRWKLIAEILDPLVLKARDRAAVRSTQLKKGAGSPNQRSISFGRIGWNSQGHKKWVHASPTSDGVEFIDTEVWAPSWTTCEREARPPDVYVAVRNEQSATPIELPSIPFSFWLSHWMPMPRWCPVPRRARRSCPQH
jgi:hypothetical protein